jgi:hypothetical protein
MTAGNFWRFFGSDLVALFVPACLLQKNYWKDIH